MTPSTKGYPSEESKTGRDDPGKHQAELDQLTGMGFPHEDALRALKAAYYDVARAAEYLVTVNRHISRIGDASRASGPARV